MHRPFFGPTPLRVKGWAALGAAILVGLIAGCGGSSTTPPPGSAGPGSSPVAVVACPLPEAVQAALSSAFGADPLTLSSGQGSGRQAGQTYCNYKAPNGDDVAFTIVVGDTAATLFGEATAVNTTNPTVAVAAVPVGKDRWIANTPVVNNPEAPQAVAGGEIKGDTYAWILYRYLAFPEPSGRPAPTVAETWAVLATVRK